MDLGGFFDRCVYDILWFGDVEVENRCAGFFEVLQSRGVTTRCDGFVASSEDRQDELLAEAGGAASDEPD